MATFTVTDDIINSEQAEAYFIRADRRVMIGLRAALELLGLPTPEYARRRKTGPTPAKAAMAAYHADNPQRRPMVLAARRPNAPADLVASSRAARSERLGSLPDNLFGQVFPAS